jgi:hypothetical protein
MADSALPAALNEARAAMAVLDPVFIAVEKLLELRWDSEDEQVLRSVESYVIHRKGRLQGLIDASESLLADGYPTFDITQGDPSFLEDVDRVINGFVQLNQQLHGAGGVIGAISAALHVGEEHPAP